MTAAGVSLKRDERVLELARMSKHALAGMYRRGVRSPVGRLVSYGGGAHPLDTWTKDELLSAIIGIEYPPEVT